MSTCPRLCNPNVLKFYARDVVKNMGGAKKVAETLGTPYSFLLLGQEKQLNAVANELEQVVKTALEEGMKQPQVGSAKRPQPGKAKAPIQEEDEEDEEPQKKKPKATRMKQNLCRALTIATLSMIYVGIPSVVWPVFETQLVQSHFLPMLCKQNAAQHLLYQVLSATKLVESCSSIYAAYQLKVTELLSGVLIGGEVLGISIAQPWKLYNQIYDLIMDNILGDTTDDEQLVKDIEQTLKESGDSGYSGEAGPAQEGGRKRKRPTRKHKKTTKTGKKNKKSRKARKTRKH